MGLFGDLTTKSKVRVNQKALAEQRALEARQAETARLNQLYGSEYSWAQNPEFKLDPTLLGRSERAFAQSDPMAQLAQYAGLGKANELMGQGFDFMGPEQQQEMLDLVKKMAEKADDPRNFNFDTSGRQEEQYGNYQGIIAGGGADAIERAMRLRQRQDSESWLRGQREADLQSYGERGLGGSGLELQSLSQAQQGAAGRNALADAEMAAALEKRKMEAIGSAADLASTMRGQAIDEQALFAGNQNSILATGASIANAMRTAQANEQLGAYEAKNATLGTYADLASKIRDQSFDEAYKRGEGADDFTKLNTDYINATNSDNVDWYRQEYEKTMQRKMDILKLQLDAKIDAASGLMGTDERENTAGFTQGMNVGMSDANAQNRAREGYNNAALGVSGQTLDQQLAAEMARNGMIAPTGQFVGKTFDEIIKAATGAYGGASMGGGAAGASGAAGGGGFNLGNFGSMLNLGSLGGGGTSGGSQSGNGSGNTTLKMPGQGFDYSEYLKRTGGQW